MAGQLRSARRTAAVDVRDPPTCKRYPKSGEAAQSHAHLQNKSNINVTLGGAEDE
jgi:hypothetical protein